MADDKHPEQDPAEGSREIVEHQLNHASEERTVKKPDKSADGPRGGEKNAGRSER